MAQAMKEQKMDEKQALKALDLNAKEMLNVANRINGASREQQKELLKDLDRLQAKAQAIREQLPNVIDHKRQKARQKQLALAEREQMRKDKLYATESFLAFIRQAIPDIDDARAKKLLALALKQREGKKISVTNEEEVRVINTLVNAWFSRSKTDTKLAQLDSGEVEDILRATRAKLFVGATRIQEQKMIPKKVMTPTEYAYKVEIGNQTYVITLNKSLSPEVKRKDATGIVRKTTGGAGFADDESFEGRLRQILLEDQKAIVSIANPNKQEIIPAAFLSVYAHAYAKKALGSSDNTLSITAITEQKL